MNKIVTIFIVSLSIFSGLFFWEMILRAVNLEKSKIFEVVEFGANEIKDKKFWIPDEDLFWVKKDYVLNLEEMARGQQSIVFMGDSCTEGGIWPYLLGDLVRQNAIGKQFRTVAVGTSGWSTYQGLVQLKRDIVSAKPKSIMIYFGWNDHWLAYGFSDKHMGDLLGILQSKILKDLEITKIILRTILKIKSSAEILRVRPDEFYENLTEIVKIAQKNQIIPILITAPSAQQAGQEPSQLQPRWIKELDQLIPLHEKYVQIVRQVAQENAVPLCDLSDNFSKLPILDRQKYFFSKDGIHLTNEGSQKAAQFLYQCIASGGLLEKITF